MLKRLIQLCNERGVTLSEVGEACGINYRSFYHWNKHAPSVSTVKQVADFLGVTVDDLIKEVPEDV